MPLVMDVARLKTITYRAILTTGTLIVKGSWGRKDVVGNVIVYKCYAVYTTA